MRMSELLSGEVLDVIIMRFATRGCQSELNKGICIDAILNGDHDVLVCGNDVLIARCDH